MTLSDEYIIHLYRTSFEKDLNVHYEGKNKLSDHLASLERDLDLFFILIFEPCVIVSLIFLFAQTFLDIKC